MLDKIGTAPTETKGRRIAMLWASHETQLALREWAIAQGFDLAWSHSGWPTTTRARRSDTGSCERTWFTHARFREGLSIFP